MKTKNKTKGETANVIRNNIIDFDTIDTADRADDNATWNAMRFYGEDDKTETKYKLKGEVSAEVLKRLKARRGLGGILNALKTA